MSETEKIKERYARRGPQKESNSFVHFMVAEREAEYERLIRSKFSNLENVKFLEIGAGSGYNIPFFLKLGIKPENLFVNELLEDRIKALEDGFPEIKILRGDAREIKEEKFDLVFQSTVFSSILDYSFRRELCNCMWERLNKGGLILWYDFIYDNPSNPDVKGVKISEVKSYFPDAKSFSSKKVTLAPPIGRRVSGLYPIINKLCPFLRTHVVIAIEK